MKLIKPSIAQLVTPSGEVLNLTDHGRDSVSIDYQLIENTQRMADGRMRKYVIASKKTISFNWSMVPSLTTITNPYSFQQIKSLNRVNGVASIETLLPHGYSVGNIVNINSCPKTLYNGSYKIKEVPSPTYFSFDQPSLGRDVGTNPTVLIPNSVKKLKYFKRLNNVATITTDGNHGYSTNDMVEITISELDKKAYGIDLVNGEYAITVTGPDTFTFLNEGSDLIVISGTEVPNTEIELITMRKYSGGSSGKEYIELESKKVLPGAYNAYEGTRVKLTNMNSKDGKDYNGIIKMTGSILSPGTKFAGEFINDNGAPDILEYTKINGRGVIVQDVTESAVQITGTSQKYVDSGNPRINIYSGQTHIETFKYATVDDLPGAAQIKTFYEENIYNPVTINLFYSSTGLPVENNRLTPRTFEGTDYKIISRKRQGGVSSITINTVHGLRVGDIVEITHTSIPYASFNGKFRVSNVISQTEFQYQQQFKPDFPITEALDGYIKTITQLPSESIQAFMTGFNFNVVKRLGDMDYWDVSLVLEEV